MTKPHSPSDNPRPEHNKAGSQPPTQKHESNRTEESRNDRDTHIGSGNQNQQRSGHAGPTGR